MGKIWLNKLMIENCNSIRTAVIDLPKTGMMLIKAKNKDTGGSSGAGKTTVLQALNTVLGACSAPMTALQNWDPDAGKLNLILVLDTDDGQAVIQKGVKNCFQQAEKEIRLTGAKAVSEAIERLLGVPIDLLPALTYAPQDDRRDFLSLTNSEKQTFLVQVLPALQVLEKAVEASQLKLSDLEKTVEAFKSVVEVRRQTAAAADAAVTDLATRSDAVQVVQLKVHQDDLALVQGNMAAAKEKLHKFDTGPVVEPEQVRELREQHRQAALVIQETLRQPGPTVPEPATGPEEVRLTQLLAMAKTKRDEVQTADRARQAQVDADRSLALKEITIIQKEIQSYQRLREEADRLQKQIPQLEANNCPTCEQTWPQAAKQLDQIRARVTEIGRLTGGLPKAEQMLAERQAYVQQLKFEPSPVLGQIQGLIAQTEPALQVEAGKRVAEQQNQQRLASATYRQQTQMVVDRGTEIKRLYDAAAAEVAASRQRDRQILVDIYQGARDEFNILTSNIQNLRLQIQAIQDFNEQQVKIHEHQKRNQTETRDLFIAALENLATKNSELMLQKDFVSMVGREGFLGLIFDEILAEISAETNAILGKVANVAHLTLEFRSEVETQAGKLKREIKPVVSVSGHEATLDYGLSGGMKTALRLAVRVAMRRVISRRTGAFPQWMCLDEAFNGLDPVSKEAVAEILGEAARDSLLLVIDHGTEFKSLFPTTLDLEYSAGVTTVMQGDSCSP